ncbi:hypothetical protein [Ensifer sp. ENS09]|nr:hypothetical protein [Ensifer sp. ENS09]
MNAILDEWDRRQSIGNVIDNRHLAYMLATVFHEPAERCSRSPNT